MPNSSEYTAHVSAKKKEVVAEFVKLLDQYPIIGAVDVENLPSLQLNRMRAQLRGNVHILMAKKRLLSIALKESKKKGVSDLEPYLKGMPALIFTKESPFKLFKTLKKSKSKAPIRAGQIAPNDIVVPAGGTNFAPGPVIGELGSFGIKSGIENGKIAIKADHVVAKEGTEVSQKLASILTRLGIEPMEIGLNLTAVWEDGDILTKDVLDVDEDKYKQDIASAASWAFNLAMYAGYPTTETIVPLLAKAQREATAVALSQDIMTDETKNQILAKAEAQATALKNKVPNTPIEEKKDVKEKTSDSDDSTKAPEGEGAKEE